MLSHRHHCHESYFTSHDQAPIGTTSTDCTGMEDWGDWSDDNGSVAQSGRRKPSRQVSNVSSNLQPDSQPGSATPELSTVTSNNSETLLSDTQSYIPPVTRKAFKAVQPSTSRPTSRLANQQVQQQSEPSVQSAGTKAAAVPLPATPSTTATSNQPEAASQPASAGRVPTSSRIAPSRSLSAAQRPNKLLAVKLRPQRTSTSLEALPAASVAATSAAPSSSNEAPAGALASNTAFHIPAGLTKLPVPAAQSSATVGPPAAPQLPSAAGASRSTEAQQQTHESKPTSGLETAKSDTQPQLAGKATSAQSSQMPATAPTTGAPFSNSQSLPQAKPAVPPAGLKGKLSKQAAGSSQAAALPKPALESDVPAAAATSAKGDTAGKGLQMPRARPAVSDPNLKAKLAVAASASSKAATVPLQITPALEHSAVPALQLKAQQAQLPTAAAATRAIAATASLSATHALTVTNKKAQAASPVTANAVGEHATQGHQPHIAEFSAAKSGRAKRESAGLSGATCAAPKTLTQPVVLPRQQLLEQLSADLSQKSLVEPLVTASTAKFSKQHAQPPSTQPQHLAAAVSQTAPCEAPAMNGSQAPSPSVAVAPPHLQPFPRKSAPKAVSSAGSSALQLTPIG